jgi:hypothetical protein
MTTMLIVVAVVDLLFSLEVEPTRSDNFATLRSTCCDEIDHFPLA